MYPPLQSRADILKMLDEMTEARKQILQRCEQLTMQQLDDPVYPGTWSVLQNLSHLAWAEEWMLAWVKKRPGTLPPEQRPPEHLWNCPPSAPRWTKAMRGRSPSSRRT